MMVLVLFESLPIMKPVSFARHHKELANFDEIIALFEPYYKISAIKPKGLHKRPKLFKIGEFGHVPNRK